MPTYVNIDASLGSGGGGGGGFANPATANLDMNSFSIEFSGGNSIWTVQPAAGGAGILAAIIAANAAGGGIVQLFPGTYEMVTINLNTIDNVTLQGYGPGVTILEVDTDDMVGNQVFDFNSDNTADICNNTTAGQTQITTTTAGAAAAITAGRIISLIGTDVNGERTSEVVQAAANGDGGTGIVLLVSPLLRTMTSVTAESLSHGYNIVLKDFTIRRVAGTAFATVITMDHGYKEIIDNVWIEEFDTAGSIAMRVAGCTMMKIKNVNVINCDSFGLNATYSFGTEVENCYFNACGLDGTSATIQFDQNASDFRVENNQILNAGSDALLLAAASGNSTHRGVINRNLFARSVGSAISLIKSLDIDITNNVFDGIQGAYCVTSDSAPRRICVDSNVFTNSKRAVNASQWVDGSIADNAVRFMVNQAFVLQQSCTGVDVTGNSIGNTGDTAILLSGVTRNLISSNTIHDSSDKGISLGDSDHNVISGNLTAICTSSGINLGSDCDNNTVCGNNTNGDGIVMSTGLNNISIGNVEGCEQVATRSVAASGSTNSADMVILVDTAAARTITLSTSDVAEGRRIVIKDSTGGATVFNITVDTQGAELIDGAATAAIVLNYGSLTLISDGTNWLTV